MLATVLLLYMYILMYTDEVIRCQTKMLKRIK